MAVDVSWAEWAGASSDVAAGAVPVSSWVSSVAAGSREPSWPAVPCPLLAISLCAAVVYCSLTWPELVCT